MASIFSGRHESPSPGISLSSLCGFFLAGSLGLNLLLTVLPWTPERKTVLNYTFRFLAARARTDSWGQMHVALADFRAHPERPLYTEVFFTHHVRFPYAPPSLLLMALVERLPFDPARFLNWLSWGAVWATAGVTIVLFGRASGPRRRRDRVAAAFLVVAYTLTFFPILRGFTLGQIQTIMNLLLAAALLAWLRGAPGLAGALAALPCLVKPQYGLLLVWAASRRRWRFAAAFTAVLGVASVLSLARFGWRNHVDYLRMLAYIARHGESFYANNSANGLFQRLLFNGENLSWQEATYPPFNPYVYVGTIVTSAVLVFFCLIWRRREHRAASGVDLMIALLTAVMASPVAWQHHYGIVLPMYASVAPALSRRRVLGGATMSVLAASYVLVANFLGVTNLVAGTRWNVVQSYLLAGVAMLLIALYRLRTAEQASASIS